ncbi:MAG: hypothetical protein VX642_04015 [Bdellovibrionota bacterium]|nr:hypothetical protein [Bdellovibrionota bacterium]
MKSMSFKFVFLCILFAFTNPIIAQATTNVGPTERIKFSPPETFIPDKTLAGHENGLPVYYNTLNPESSYGFDKVLLIQGDQTMPKSLLTPKTSSYYVIAIKGQDVYYYPYGRFELKQSISESGDIVRMVNKYHQEEFNNRWHANYYGTAAGLSIPLMLLGGAIAHMLFPSGEALHAIPPLSATMAIGFYISYRIVKASKVLPERIFNIRQNLRVEVIDKHFGEKNTTSPIKSSRFYVKRSEVFEYNFNPEKSATYGSCAKSGNKI